MRSVARGHNNLQVALLLAGLLVEIGWVLAAAASVPLTESYDFTATLMGQTGGLWTWAIPLRRAPREMSSQLLVGALVLTTLGYLVGIAVVARWRGRFAPTWTMGLALVFVVTLLAMPGLLSSDMLTYSAYGRMSAVYGLNPYVYPPTAIETDSLVRWLAAPPEHVSLYGPLWTAISVILAQVTADLNPLEQALGYRLVGAMAHLANCYLVWQLVPLFAPASEPGPRAAAENRLVGRTSRRLALLLYAWNPLVLLEVIGSAHNDGLMQTLVLAGLLLVASRARWWTAVAVVWAAVLVKWVPVVPLLFMGATWMQTLDGWRSRAVRVGCMAAALAMLTLLLFGPWLDLQDASLLLANLSAGGERYVNSLVDLPTPWLAGHWLDPQGRDLQAAETTIRVWVGGAVRVLFLAYLALEIRRLWATRGDLRAAVETSTRVLLVALLLVFTQVLPWYFVWPLTLGTTLGWRSSVGNAAVAYAILYLPIFYATHQNVLSTTAAAPVLLVYAVLPPLIARVIRGGTMAAARRETAVGVAFRA